MTAQPDRTRAQALLRRLARAALDTRALGTTTSATRLDEITLLPHQDAAVRWLDRRLDRFGGALLADPPGLGKTYVALAIAHRRRTTPLVIAPAALRTRWRDATRETGVHIDFVSTERLSAPAPIRLAPHQLVIIDEAHHLRTPHTRRHARTTDACRDADVLLLSATPVHNGTADLEHLTALFHLPPARAGIATLRRRLTLRRSIGEVHAAGALEHDIRIPPIRHHRPLALRTSHDTLLPTLLGVPPLQQAEADEGHQLLLIGLLHALRSSDAAARQFIRRRVASTIAIEQAVSAGVTPTLAVRRAWKLVGDDVQLAMPLLLGHANDSPNPALAAGAVAQRLALRAMLPMLHGAGDRTRATALRRLARWSTRPVVAFTWSAATAAALFHLLRHTPGIALLAGSGGRIASGRISRADLLQRLLAHPGARHTNHMAPGRGRPLCDDDHERSHPSRTTARYRDTIRLLITTDVISEGLSLAGVGTVVHLDHPWTPARIDQRIGRAARIGAPVPHVDVVTLEAPLPHAARAAMQSLLARKRRAMRRVSADVPDEEQIIRFVAGIAHASADQPRRPLPSWTSVESALVDAPLVMAVVSLNHRRQLVALQRGVLRRPSRDDWCAVAAVYPAPQIRLARGHIRQLRLALRAHLAEHALCEQVRTVADLRVRARTASDDALLRGQWQARAQHAIAVSGAREQLMRLTRPRDLASLAAACDIGLPRASSDAAAYTPMSHGARPSRESVRLHAGVVLLPAGGGPDEVGYIASQ